MAIQGPAVSDPADRSASSGVMYKGLKEGAIGYVSNIVIGVASTAPAYSLAATLGFVAAVKGVGTHAPAVLLVAFVPMLLVAAAYKYFNRADPDAGTSRSVTVFEAGEKAQARRGRPAGVARPGHASHAVSRASSTPRTSTPRLRRPAEDRKRERPRLVTLGGGP